MCSDCVPPSTAASAWYAVRTTLFNGCWAVRVEPAVWVWNRIFHAASVRAPTRSRISRAHSRRAARYLAASSNRWLWAFQKNESRGANVSTSSPAATAAST